MSFIKNKLRLLIVFALTFVVCSVFFIIYVNVNADTVSFSYADELKNKYDKEDVIDIPEGTVRIGSEEYSLKHVLTYPDGKESVNKNNVLDQTGLYCVEYFCSANGNKYSDKKTFTVEIGYKSVFSSELGIRSDGYVEIPSEIADEDYFGSVRHGVGLTASAEGATTNYNGYINLKDTGVFFSGTKTALGGAG